MGFGECYRAPVVLQRVGTSVYPFSLHPYGPLRCVYIDMPRDSSLAFQEERQKGSWNIIRAFARI